MKSLWNDEEAGTFLADPLQLRVYTSRLLGSDPALVLHGGGNTSVKASEMNMYGAEEEVLYVKGSGWDLATIEAEGFSPVRMNALLRLAEMANLTDSDIVRAQRAALTNPYAPDPSVEAILHAIVPFQYVDHTHTDAVVTVTNTPGGWERIETIYGKRVLIVPYVMPGFILAKKVYEMTRNLDWNSIEGIVLMNHGVFTFANDARISYETMIRLVSEAEEYLAAQGAWGSAAEGKATSDLVALSQLRGEVSRAAGKAMIARLESGSAAVGFADLSDAASIATRGPLTPDHVIRTKRIPTIIDDNIKASIDGYVEEYQRYFDRNTDGTLTMLDPAPRWAVWPGYGMVAFGESVKVADIVADINRHTIRAIQWGEALDEWHALPEKDIFDVEYWELEQAKLKRGGIRPPLAGKVALVTGAASGIGKACAGMLEAQGAAVVGLDINPQVTTLFAKKTLVGLECDVTNSAALTGAVEEVVRTFGGPDILVSNAGIFPASKRIEEMETDLWQHSLDLNLTSHQRLMQACLPYLKHGIDPAIIVIASKNVPAPGPGQSAYSVAKAGLTQLARVAALELGKFGIRVNVIHPNAVFDTGAWTPEVLEARAKHYGLTVEEYKTSNVLGVEVTSEDVARLVCAMAGPVFGKITGAQIPLDGGNERVI